MLLFHCRSSLCCNNQFIWWIEQLDLLFMEQTFARRESAVDYDQKCVNKFKYFWTLGACDRRFYTLNLQ